MAIGEKKNSFHVPTIDIAPFLNDPTSEASHKIIEGMREACLSTGFFQITGHGVPKELQKSIFESSNRFFRLPTEEKLRLDCTKTAGYRGYDVLGTQSYEEGVLSDWKEGFFVGHEIPESHSHYGRYFSGPNVWPSKKMLPSEDFETPCLQYFEALKVLSFKVFNLIGITLLPDHERENALEALANGQPLLPSSLQDIAYADAWPILCLRLLRYPSATKAGDSPDKPQYGASAHSDFSAITLLLQDDNPGLEVIDTSPAALATGKTIWRPIDPNPDAYVVNIGDIVQKVTGGLYKSSVHRVVCKRPENERYSVVFFVDGCVNAKLHPLQDSFLNGHIKGLTSEVETVEEHMYERLGMSYGNGKKDPRRDGETVMF